MKMEWPSAVVAVGIFAVLGAIVIAAIVKYDSADEAMTVFGGIWGALGAGVGLVFAYFFTRGPIADAKQTADKAMSMTKDLQQQVNDMRNSNGG